ncbi:glycosyltransferase [Methylobacterium durans]|uniref:glycosyltransferase n=1 Tax=Methylobacterium durans TaxID=2202825 RepID=UPI002AFFB85A|nr:glycosyltransferase [Methylobacterium durans]MEA1832404.1 glycosyltransferase [Methylobacterium durans]
MRYLSLATYPISAPRHGGQIRVNAIHRILRERGWTTEHVAVYEAAAQAGEPDSEFLFPLTERFQRELARREGRPDVDVGDFLIHAPDQWQRFCRIIDEFRPDIVACEQPWLWPALRRYLDLRPGLDIRIVYSSQNVEGRLIASVTAANSPEARTRLAARTLEIESDIVGRADAIIVVSQGDHDHFAPSGKPILLAPNGVWASAPATGMNDWRRELAPFSTMLFVGSGHPPNAIGFADMLGPRLSYLAPDERIVVVGTVADLLDRTPGYSDWYGLNAARLIIAGSQEEGGLSSLLKLAGGVVLPITVGGGTNLKTAEALYNRKRVIATSTAMRGYERFMAFPGLTICDDPTAFKQAVRACLAERGGPLSYTLDQMEMLDSLLWSTTLRQFGPFLSLLIEHRPSIEARTTKFASDEAEDQHAGLTPHLLSGWYAPEPNGVWSKESVAILRIETEPGSPAPTRVRCLLTGMAPKGRPQEIEIFCPSGLKKSLTYRFRGRKMEAVLDVADGDLDPAGTLEIYFQVSHLASPQDLGRSGDDRKLGICLASLQIDREGETNEAARAPRAPKGAFGLPPFGAATRLKRDYAALVRAIRKRVRPIG